MGADHTSDGSDAHVETAEERADRRPPPPPDRPGTEGYPSRADSRNGAAAANDTNPQPSETAASRHGENKPQDTARRTQPAGEQTTATDQQPETAGPREPNEPRDNDAGVSGERSKLNRVQNEIRGQAEGAAPPVELGDPGRQPQTQDHEAGPPDIAARAAMDGKFEAQDPIERIDPPAANGSSATDTGPASANDSLGAGTDDLPVPISRHDEDAVQVAPDTHAPTHGLLDASSDVASSTIPEAAKSADDSAEVPAQESPANEGPRSAEQLPDDAEGPLSAENRRGPDAAAIDHPGADGLTTEHVQGAIKAEASTANAEHAEGDRAESGVGNVGSPDTPAEPSAKPGDAVNTLEENGTSPEVSVPDWAKGVDKLSDLPTGEELLNMEDDKLSRLDKLRREGYRKISDALDVTHKGFDLGIGAFERPPTHAETRSVQPEVVEAPHHTVTVGEAATGFIVVGVLVSELLRRGRDKLTQRKAR